jgi:hypothetical protein
VARLFDIRTTEHFNASRDGSESSPCGVIYHIQWSEHGGSVSTPIGQYFTHRPHPQPEGYFPHWRLDCFIWSHPLSPDPRVLTNQLADALLQIGVVSEPIWIEWRVALKGNGEARGQVFDHGQ